jgi:DNA polymerase III subunit alpha
VPEAGFVHLHVHSEYSILDGACRIPALAARAAEFGMPSVALTDHGSLAGAVELYREAGKQGIKPILGCEVYVADDRRALTKGYAHLTLLARGNEGYGNLIKLSSLGYLEGYYYKPRVDWELLERHASGLIALSGCLSGRVCKALEESRPNDAAADLDRLAQIFGRDNTYVEIQNAGLATQALINPQLAELAAGTGLPLVATGDVHYLEHGDARAHEALLCIQSGDSLRNPSRWKFDTDQFFFKSPEEMAADFPGHEEAMRRTLEIAERCNVELELGRILLPEFPTPDGRDSFEYLVELSERGLEKRYGHATSELTERLKFELKTIREMGFVDYFLIVWDFVSFAKRNGISVGPGRGSTAGSLVAYCLQITDVDPIKYDLLFERFLNPGRKSLPDADIDFAVEGRDRVINYVAEKYGRDRVAQIITFGTMAARAAVRDAGRVLEIPYGVVDKVAKLIPEGPGQTLDACLKPGQPLKQEYDRDPVAREVVDLAKPLEGLTRQDSIHAAGVVIGAQPLIEVVPLQQKGADQEVVTQFAGGDVEALGLLKIDFLGLRNLDVLEKARELAAESRSREQSSHDLETASPSRRPGGIDWATLPLDDPKVYELLSRGDSTGVFQFESSGMREALRQVKPTEFEHLIALVSLYRPGPMAYIPVYARRKNGQEPVTYVHERLKPITGSTYGIALYQEQYMEIAKEMAGFTLFEAEDLRKAIGKKNHKLMASLKDKFLEGCAANNVPPGVAQQLWKDTEASQDYSFNKSHAAAYALIAYRTAYMKAHHPREYMAALISSVMNTKDRVPYYVNACDEMGIEVLPPDVNESQLDFAVVEGKIRFGLSAVKNVGEPSGRGIIRAREEGGPFTSIWDFTERVDPAAANKRALESLVKCGALDSTGDSRLGMLECLEQALAWGQRQQADRLAGQGSIFDLGDDVGESRPRHHPVVPVRDVEKNELLRMEKETLGVYVSEHPLHSLRDQLRLKTDATLAELERRRDGEVVTVGGIVSAVKALTTKKGEPMVFLRLDDVTGGAEVVVFNSTYAAARELCVTDRILVVKGRVDHKQEGETKLIAMEVSPFEAVAARRDVTLRIDARVVRAGVIRDLATLVKDFPGDSRVNVILHMSEGDRQLVLGPQFKVQPVPDFFAEAKALLGEAAVL